MNTRPPTLAAHVLNGDDRLCLTEPVPDRCWITLSKTARDWEEVRVWRCTGTGPYVVDLGLNINQPAQVHGTYVADSPVGVRNV